METDRKNWIYVAFLAVLLFVLRSPALMIPVLDADEAIYSLFSRLWFDGGIPYIDCVETKPLGIYALFGAIFSIFGKYNMIAVHAVTIVIVGATAYVINLIAAGLYSKKAGFFAALLYIVFGTTYIPKYIATTIEPVMLLPVVLQFYFWIKFERYIPRDCHADLRSAPATTTSAGRRNDSGVLFAFLSGMAFSASCLFKYQAGMNLVILVLYIFAVKPVLNRRLPSGRDLKGFGWFIIGAIPLPLIMLAYIWHAGALEAFWYWTIGGSLKYLSEGAASAGLGRQFLVRVLPYVASTGLLWFLCAVMSVKIIKAVIASGHRKRSNPFESKRLLRHYAPSLSRGFVPRNDSLDSLVLLWFLLSLVPVCAGHRFYGHYFYLLLPPMAILAAPVLERTWAVRWKRNLALFWIILPATGFFAARFFISDIHRAVGEDTLDNYRPLAAYVSQHTSPGDKIVVWGFAPLVYWYSERLPATRFFWSDLLVGRVPGLKNVPPEEEKKFISEDAWGMFMSDLDRRRPIYIIDTAPTGFHDYEKYPLTRYPRIWEYVKNNYREEATMNGAVFYRRVNR